MIRYIIFDFDDTLADSKDVFIAVYNQIALKNKYRPMDEENLQHLRTLAFAARCRYLKVPLYKIPFLAAEFLNLYKTSLQNVRLFKGISEVLVALQLKGVETAIISSNNKSNIQEILRDNGIDSITKIYCSSSLFGKDKLINGFLKKYGLAKDQVLYVGDELRDITACKKAGIAVAWVEWGYDIRQSVIDAEPDYIFSEPADILSVLQTNFTPM